MRNLLIDNCARAALNKILGTSIVERAEYGGMIYLEDGKYKYTDARTQGYGNTVNVGQWEENRSCPEGSTPVAYYHTHPNFQAGKIPMEYNKFSPEDISLCKDLGLHAYMGSLDGTFWVYDPQLDKPIKIHGRLNNSTPEKKAQ
jgi:hypothetical protein